MRLTPKMIGIVVFFAVITVYAFYQTHALAEGPEIILEEPTVSSLVTTNPVLVIKGQAKQISRLYLNNWQIFTNQDGHFNEKLLLARGYNKVSLRAEDKFGREIASDFELVYKPSKKN